MPQLLPLGITDGDVFTPSSASQLLPPAVDFTALGVGPITLPVGWALARASSNDTVQTSADTIASGIAANTARGGNDGAGHSGLVIEETRTNVILQSRIATFAGAWASVNATATFGFRTSPDQVSSSTRVQAPTIAGTGVLYQAVQAALSTVKWALSAWYVQGGGASSFQFILSGNSISGLYGDDIGAVWSKESFSFTGTGEASGFANYDIADNRAQIGGASALARDNLIDLCQMEQGAFGTEAIVTTTVSGTRSGEQLTYSPGSGFVDGGRINAWFSCQPKGSSSQYSADMHLWHIDSNNNALISYTTGKLIVTIGGTAFTSLLAMAWNAGDLVDIWVAAGGGTYATRIEYRVNGGAPVLLSGNAAPVQGVITPGGSIDIGCSGTTNQFTAWFGGVFPYKSGNGPLWLR